MKRERKVTLKATISIISQIFLWVVIFILLFVVISADFDFGEFRYVAF